MPQKLVQPIHFEDYSGHQFERLVFAYHLRAGWTDLAWIGQTGSDGGRDIVGTDATDGRSAKRTIIQCKNTQALTKAQAKDEIQKSIRTAGTPDAIRFVCRANVSAAMRDTIAKDAKALGVPDLTIWSGQEFEEHLRLRGEYLLKRFVDGVDFPEGADQLRTFVDEFPALSDSDILNLMAAVFERPVFTTPFSCETSLPAFQQAIEDTIGALNTGNWKMRDGTEIRKIPSLHHLKDPKLKATVLQVTHELDDLRRTFKKHLQAKTVRPCQCGKPECSLFMVDLSAERDLNATRTHLLRTFSSAYPSFRVALR